MIVGFLGSGAARDLAEAVSGAKELGVTPKSGIGPGKTWPAPAGATRVKTFEIYR